MGLINRDTDYAVRALCFIAEEETRQVVSVCDLVKKLKMPRPFLRKILQRLTQEGMLRSYRGKGGGFKLRVAPDRIFLVDLIELFQGPVRLTECFFKKQLCSKRDTCSLKKQIDTIEKKVISELETITIASLIDAKVNLK